MITIADPADQEHFDVPLGQEYQIALTENRTTGFRWTAQVENATSSLASESTDPPAPQPGAASVHRWVFRAETPGAAKIRFSLGRAWEAQPQKTLTITVTVR